MAIDSDAGRYVNADIAAGIPPVATLFHSLADLIVIPLALA